MELLPNVEELKIIEDEIPESIEKEEPKVNLKVSPFVETPKKRKKKVKKIVEEIDENNEPEFTEVSAAKPEEKIHIDAEEKMRNQIRECIAQEMREKKEIKKVKTKRPLTEKQKQHMEKMREMSAKKRCEKQRIKDLEEKLSLKTDAKKEDINIYIDNYLKEKEIEKAKTKLATPKKVEPSSKPKPVIVPKKAEPLYNPFNYDSCF